MRCGLRHWLRVCITSCGSVWGPMMFGETDVMLGAVVGAVVTVALFLYMRKGEVGSRPGGWLYR